MPGLPAALHPASTSCQQSFTSHKVPVHTLCYKANHCVSNTQHLTGGAKEFLVRASYLEIYNEEIRDLLSKSPEARLELKEHPDRGVYVKDLMQFVVKSVAEIGSVLQVRLTEQVHPECCLAGGLQACTSAQQAVAGWQLVPHSCTCATPGVGGLTDDCRPVHGWRRLPGATVMTVCLSLCACADMVLPGGQEEPCGGCHLDEPGQLSLPLHLHHHHRGHRALQQHSAR
eukprot:GHRQ01019442.1.p1 GENE.GHRQ01019442.1~~GHRQ01019442.1.p1  ORF type:complete len:229 (+),score=30.05 GHRQ01019442.1:1193-1879(+)